MENRLRKTAQAFELEWTRHGNLSRLYSSEEKLFEEFARYKIPESFFADKKILDAGCGMGRYSYVAAKKGAREVWGVDIHKGILFAQRLNQDLPQVHILKADIFNLPFQQRSFDSIMGIGVLHHTGDAHRAFRELLKFLKPRGQIFIQLYRKRNRIKNRVNSLIRRFTLILPPKILYGLCFVAVALATLPILRQIVRVLNVYITAVSISPFRNFWRRVADTYDWYSCPYQTFHTTGEMVNLYNDCGLENIQITNPGYPGAINIIGTKKR